MINQSLLVVFKKNGWTASLLPSWLIAVLTAAVAMNARQPCFNERFGGTSCEAVRSGSFGEVEDAVWWRLRVRPGSFVFSIRRSRGSDASQAL
jgi:hypothetical protein